MRAWFIRHAESVGNAGGDCNGDCGLSPQGREQAKYLRLPTVSEPFTFVVSPLKRALETAYCAFVYDNGENIDIHVNSLLRELGVTRGHEGGSSRLWLREKFGSLFRSVSWDLHPDWPDEIDFPESTESLNERVRLFKEYLKTIKTENVAILGHAHFYRALTGSDEKIPNCAIRQITD